MRCSLALLLLVVRSAVGGKRRRELESLLVKVMSLSAYENSLESEERGKSKAKVEILRPEQFTSPADLGLLTAVNDTVRLTLRAYFALTEIRQGRPVKRGGKKGSSSGEVWLAGSLNWGSGGFTLVARLSGVSLVPVRLVYEMTRLVVVRVSLAATAPDWTRLRRFLEGLDLLLIKGPGKGIPELFPMLDLRRSSRFGKPYHLYMSYTKTARYTARTAWRTPRDIAKSILATFSQSNHERLEAVLLRAAVTETRKALDNLKNNRKQKKQANKKLRKLLDAQQHLSSAASSL